jgi:tRNA-modifying protein YgfZ
VTFLAERPGHGVVSVSGPDATTFLESLVSQELATVEPGSGTRSLLLTPKGKLDVAFRALALAGPEPYWLLDCDEGFGPRLAESLTRYRIRVDAEIRDESASWALLEVRGPDAAGRVAAVVRVDVPDEEHAHVTWSDSRITRARWPGTDGVDVLGPVEDVHHARDELLRAGVDPLPHAAYEARRIAAGIPKLGVDIDEQTIPQEAFLERDSVSFTKGCFLGQELVCRIDTRGHVNRHLRLLRIDGATAPPAGTEVLVADTAVGAVTSAATVPDREAAVALAMVRHEVTPPARAQLRWSDGEVSASVEELPRTGS